MATGPSDPLSLSNQLCFAVYSAAQAMTRAYRPLLAPLGLTYPQFIVMLALWERDGDGIGQLGARLRLDSNTLTPLVKRLEKAGHVERRRDPGDERVVRVFLTEGGRDMRARASGIPAAIGCAAALPPDQLADLRGRMIALRDAMDEPRPGD